MDWNNYFFAENEQPLDRFPEGISNTAIFRTIAFVGDSLSSGEFESRNAQGQPGYHDWFEYSWGQYIARKNGLTAYNFSRGGMTAKEYMESFGQANGFWNPELAAQAYVIALGVNDLLNAGWEMGSVEDVTDNWQENPKTFAGYFGGLVQRYKEIQPQAKFFFLTMPHDGGPRDEKKAAHARLMYELAEKLGNAYVIDLFKYGPAYDKAFCDRFFLYGHMNASGYIFTANMVDAYIDYLIRKYPDDFRRVPFIGKGLQ